VAQSRALLRHRRPDDPPHPGGLCTLAACRKRGSGAIKLALDEAMAVPQVGADIDLLGLNDALDRLAELDERQGRIVELRFFAGLSIEETAEVMHLSPASIKREWQTARAWLFREMTRTPAYEA
jgi:RNA polymerase sigma factor (TIGR02999 family)